MPILGLNDTTDPTGWWRWDVDRTCEFCAWYLDKWEQEKARRIKASGANAEVTEETVFERELIARYEARQRGRTRS